MAQTCTNFAEYPTGVPSDWTLTVIGGTATPEATVEENANALSGKWLKFTADTDGFWARFLAEWDDVPSSTEGEILLLLRYTTDDESGSAKNYGPAARSVNTGVNAVVASLGYTNGSEATAFSKYVSDTLTGLDTDNSPGVTFTGGEDYWVRFNFTDGDLLKLRYWALGDPEPSSWNHEYDASGDSLPSAAGLAGVVLNRLEPSSGDNDVVYLHFFGFSDDPAVSVVGPIADYHDNTTDFEGLSGNNWNHTQATLQNGLAVLRVINLATQSDFFPTYDGQAMTYADITGGGVPGRVPSSDVGIWYLPLGANASGTTAAINIQGPGGANVAVKATISTYEDCDQDNPLIDTGWASGSPPNDLPATDNFGVVLNMDDKGYLVVDVLHSGGEADPTNPQCGKIIRADDSDFTADGQEYVFGDRTSEAPAGYMYYSDFQVTVTAFLGAASFRKALPTFSPTFGIPSEHLEKIAATLGIPSEHLLEIVQEVLNRKRLWVDLGADVRTIKVEL